MKAIRIMKIREIIKTRIKTIIKTIKQTLIKAAGCLSIIGFIVFGQSIYAEDLPVQHEVWNKAPINVVLPVGKERIVSFPGVVQFGYDRGVLPASKLRVQNNDGALYFLAKGEFSPQRVEVKLSQAGKIVLLNLSAQKEASDIQLSIIMPKQPIAGDNAVSGSTFGSTIDDGQVDYVTLMRFAVKQLYAPDRLLEQPANIYRAAMETSRTVSLFLDGNVVAMPQISWRGGDYFVTAVTLRNLTKHSLHLSPTQLCGNWISTAFFPISNLKSKGTLINGIPYDSTTAFLISDRPFGEAVSVCNGRGI